MTFIAVQWAEKAEIRSELVDFGIGNTSIESEISIIRDSALNSFLFLKPKKQFCYVRGLKFQIWNGDEGEYRVATNRNYRTGRTILTL